MNPCRTGRTATTSRTRCSTTRRGTSTCSWTTSPTATGSSASLAITTPKCTAPFARTTMSRWSRRRLRCRLHTTRRRCNSPPSGPCTVAFSSPRCARRIGMCSTTPSTTSPRRSAQPCGPTGRRACSTPPSTKRRKPPWKFPYKRILTWRGSCTCRARLSRTRSSPRRRRSRRRRPRSPSTRRSARAQRASMPPRSSTCSSQTRLTQWRRSALTRWHSSWRRTRRHGASRARASTRATPSTRPPYPTTGAASSRSRRTSAR
mmetsp:Transcript_18428/g.59965  ORF Transcript_18428/g.59965 Transcript_18428/m.59965 type:complete len:261 (+) Transcript_18428:706-1488(+)